MALQTDYRLIRSRRRKTMCAEVHPGGELVVRAPSSSSASAIDAFVASKSRWIERWVGRMKALPRRQEWSFESLERFPYLGGSLTLIVESSPRATEGRAQLDGDRLAVVIPKGIPQSREKKAIRSLIRAWYIDEAGRVLPSRARHFSEILHVTPGRVRVGDQRRRWGSCSRTGTVSLNWRLLMAPPPVIDYVTVHELCHLRHMNHSRAFWRCVGEAAPDYLRWRKWLRENGQGMEL